MDAGVLITFVASFAVLGILLRKSANPSLYMSLSTGMLFLTLMCFVLTMYVYTSKGIVINSRTDVYVLITRFVHYLVLILTASYIFIFSPSSDAVYIILDSLLVLHWVVFKWECCLTYIENKLLDPAYIMGSKPYQHVWLQIIFGNYHVMIMIFVSLLVFYNSGVVINRYFANTFVKYGLIGALFTFNLYNNLQRLTI